MAALEIAELALVAAEKAAELIEQAIETAKAGDDARALEQLDEALAHFDAGSSPARAALAKVKADTDAEIAEKFDTGGEPTT